MVIFPVELYKPLQDSYSYDVESGVAQSNLSATPRNQRTTTDRLRVHQLTFLFPRGQARLMRQWLITQADNGYKPTQFTLDGRTFIAKFASKPRMPSLRSGKDYTYTFSIVERL